MLIEQIRDVLERLAPEGWAPIFQVLGVDPGSPDLRGQLLTTVSDLSAVRAMPGFEEVSPDALRPIEPGRPALSLLYHALAGPGVQLTQTANGSRSALSGFPTAADLDLAEDLVFGIEPPAFQDLAARFPSAVIAVGVFAREYRQRSATAHGSHADMVFARTGVARVGTLAAHWDGATRSYLPRREDDDTHAFRVMPCRYGVYLCVQMRGDESAFRVFRADRTFEAARRLGQRPQADKPDAGQLFWVPVHKLFSGGECLRGLNLGVDLDARHFNEKLRRIHIENMGVSNPVPPATGSFSSGFSGPVLDDAPFTVTDGLVELLDEADHGAGTVSAIVRPRLVEPTEMAGSPIGTRVPGVTARWASFTIPAEGGARKAPEWIYVRRQLRADGSETDLNRSERVASIVSSGRVGGTSPYTASHFTDFTGDGWITPVISGLAGVLDRRIPAYSLISAPDFYPYVSQSALLDWWLRDLPSRLGDGLWAVPPLTLCDQRDPPNLELRRYGAPFVPEDATVSAMVGLIDSIGESRSSSAPQIDQTSYLPDNAAGVYAPGWDTSIDFSRADGVQHLAAHGLGSPFPEDAKLCAAISAFWPSVAPDTSRSYGTQGQNSFRIVAPMTDREVGAEGAPAWDGVPGPRRVQIGGQDHIEDDSFDHIDYVRSALEGQFSMAETMKVTQREYQARIVATRRLLSGLANPAAPGRPVPARMLSFTKVGPGDPELLAAEASTEDLTAPVYRFEMVETDRDRGLVRDENDPARWLVQNRISVTRTVFVDAVGRQVVRIDTGSWQLMPMS